MQRRLESVLPHGIEHDGNALAGGQGADTGGNTVDVPDKGMMAPVGECNLRFCFRTDDADDTGAEITRPLAHDDADTASGGMHQNCLPGLNPEDVVQQVVGREPLGDHRSRSLVFDLVRHHDQSVCGQHTRFGIGAAGQGMSAARIGNPVSDA